ncbi:tudor and KH domain-containing protein isoform X2 [Sceloporus undulatus]|uniref:tudor and KH domain-containing protein isoform X2 n=1 Tax=Sceloporus undulatus TaxID=8520 RepID=UPI001C4AE61C|nr:tudor and KH domain-containing protein isoform X2 [Sceloporus undulatus]
MGPLTSERSSWSSLTTLQKVALALGIPASGAILYILYRRYRESKEERPTFVGEEEIKVEMKVPKDSVKLIVGRQGAQIKQLRKNTQARIDIDMEDSSVERIIRICGSPIQVCAAKATIHQILAENLPVQEKIEVHHRTVGRIIGRGGETVRAICKSTGAKVECEGRGGPQEGEGSLLLTRVITISGTRKEVEAAKCLIMEKLSEDDAFRRKLYQSVSSRSVHKQALGKRQEDVAKEQDELPRQERELQLPNPQPLEGAGEAIPESPLDEAQELRNEDGSPEEPLSSTSCPGSAFEVPSPDFSFHANEYLEVYISAAENPNHFWIQIIGSRALQLDKLTYEMTQYYESGGCPSEFPDVHVGDIVAARYQDDCCWYRAKVLGILDDGRWDLYYVDFGDNEEAPLKKLRPLRSDFLSLPFQAIECSLAGIAPAGSHWEEAALDEFDRLTHCSQWKPVVAKISSYVPSGSNTWPHIRLYNTSGEQSIDVGEELIRLGYAVPCLQDIDGAMGDGPYQLGKGAAASGFPKTLENMEGMSLESLLSDTQKTPDEMPLTLSCVSLSDDTMDSSVFCKGSPSLDKSPWAESPSAGTSCHSEISSSDTSGKEETSEEQKLPLHRRAATSSPSKTIP